MQVKSSFPTSNPEAFRFEFYVKKYVGIKVAGELSHNFCQQSAAKEKNIKNNGVISEEYQ